MTKSKNIGLDKATEAAKAIGAKLAVPDMHGDFNDKFVKTDLDEVCRQLGEAVQIEEETTTSVSISGGLPGSDTAFADLFVEQHANKIRSASGNCYVWDTKRWKGGDKALVQELGKQTAKSILNAASTQPHSEAAQAMAKWGVRSLSKRAIKDGVELALSDDKIRAEVMDFDADPLSLNCENGTIDLRTGELRGHRREDMISKLCPTKYDAVADCPLFDAFLDRIFGSEEALLAFIQRCAGYCSTGLTIEQAIFLLLGSGANGKSVLIETLHDLLGEYAIAASIDTLTPRRGGIPNDLARLAGARLITVGETQENAKLNESLVKDFTGGDTITARFLNKEFFDFRPVGKIVIRANHKPNITGTDHGIWRRIKLVPFDHIIPLSEQDRRLREKLRAEFPGILAWAVRGAIEWQRHGLQEPKQVRRSTRKYRNDQDVVGRFLKEKTKKKEGAYVMARALYNAYDEWCDETGEQPITEKAFKSRMEEHGHSTKRHKKGNRYINRQLKRV